MLRTSKPGLVAIYAVLGLWTLVTLFPIYWTLITSVKTPDAVYRSQQQHKWVDVSGARWPVAPLR